MEEQYEYDKDDDGNGGGTGRDGRAGGGVVGVPA